MYIVFYLEVFILFIKLVSESLSHTKLKVQFFPVMKRIHFVRWSHCYATVYNLFYSLKATRYISKCSHPLDDLWSTFFVIIKLDVNTSIPEVHKWLSTLLGFYKCFCLGRTWWFICSGFFELVIKKKFLKLKHPPWFAYGCLSSDWMWSKRKMSKLFQRGW